MLCLSMLNRSLTKGLLTVTMEGREAKHTALQKLSRNTTYQQRWYEIFRHESIMLIWLPEQNHDPCSYTPSNAANTGEELTPSLLG